jgi:hypothetical protein
MDKFEKAKQMFRELESRGVGQGQAADIARRTFFVQDSLRALRG